MSSPRTPLRPHPHPLAGAAGRALAAAVVAASLLVATPPAGARGTALLASQAEGTGSTTTTTTPGGSAAPGTAPDGGEGQDPPLPPLGELPEISEDLADVALTSDSYDEVAAERDAIAERRSEAEARERRQVQAIEEATARDAELTGQIEAARREARRWEDRADQLDDQVRAAAVGSYIRGAGADVGPLFDLDPDAHDRAVTTSITSESMARRKVGELEDALVAARRARNDIALSTAIRDGVREALAEARVARDEARADQERLAIELIGAVQALEDHRRLAQVVGADFPLVVLDAYYKAAQLMRYLAPSCGISWWAMAGIGKIESRHGTFGGAEVRADGSLTKPIIGIPLTGSNGTAAIGDSDGGLVDGDPTVDRAAGPMQFIPQTWARYGTDGDQDGRVEIQNIYDATASAARYLCAAAGSMADVGGLQRGYFSYNHSNEYVASVLAQAIRYGSDVLIDGVPLPPVAPPPPPEPAAGDPAAAADSAASTTTTTVP